ncbi:hypothetical protein [Saccharolobus caldissimus]|uniref:Uncharacterized protein n=1 Tax=Saccharolobus caldissimus TaxID=1702097 RepID=A0AAQ4CNV9_9CREN|nr:hypothetical protein [Saccharolobus caldissimus]BDB97490.1 hypothetical protein SACC_05070 [Saccharolobus caldissimus]
MIIPALVIKILLLVPAIIFLFYAAIYMLLFELNVQPNYSKIYRNISITLLGGGMIFLALYLIV